MSQVTPKPVTYELCCLEIKIIEIFSIEQSVLDLRTFLLFPKAFCLFPCPDMVLIAEESDERHSPHP